MFTWLCVDSFRYEFVHKLWWLCMERLIALFLILWNLPILEICRGGVESMKIVALMLLLSAVFIGYDVQPNLAFRSAARYTKFRNLCCSDRVRRVRLASLESFERYFQPTLWVQCFASSFFLSIFSTLLPAVRSRNDYLMINKNQKPERNVKIHFFVMIHRFLVAFNGELYFRLWLHIFCFKKEFYRR